MNFQNDLPRKMVAEVLGTMGLIIAVTGSVLLVKGTILGTAGFLLAGLAGGFVLFAMIEAFGKISGGHFIPLLPL